MFTPSELPPAPLSSQISLLPTLKEDSHLLPLLIPCLLYLQNVKSYDDLKAELGNSGDWGQIADVSMGVAWLALEGLEVVPPMGVKSVKREDIS